MKIELSKSGDVSIISTEKGESTNDSKEYKNKHKKLTEWNL